VTFLGEQRDVMGFLGQSKIFVLASLREGLSLAIIEAMAQGLPVVAHRTGGIPEVVEDGVTGYLVEPKNTAQFAEKIAQLLSDPSKRDQMGQAAKSAFEKKFRDTIMMDHIEQVYSDLIQLKVRRR
jgi:glycosyltransferase involved in cell wall biosynthesis